MSIIPDLNNRVTQYGCGSNTFSTSSCATSTLLDRFVNIGFVIITAAAIILLIWSGIQYVQAAGDQEAAKKARSRIVNIVAAIILLTLAYTIVNLATGGASYFAQLFS